MHRSLCAGLFAVLLVAGASRAQESVSTQNSADAVLHSYAWPETVKGFRFEGAVPDGDPRAGVALHWTRSDPRLSADVYLYRAAKPRLETIAVDEGMAVYLAEVQGYYTFGDRKLLSIDRKSKPYEVELGERKWRGAEHRFSFENPEGKSRSHTLLFYDSGHFIKFRVSTPKRELSERQLRDETRALAAAVLPGIKVLAPFGHRCGPPDFTGVPADDPRAKTFSEDGYEFFVPEDLPDEELEQVLTGAMMQSIQDSSERDCFGDGVRIESNG